MTERNKLAGQLWCCQPQLRKERTNHHGLPTVTSDEQINVEDSIAAFYYKKSIKSNIALDRTKHVAFLKRGLENLSQGFECLDASRPWLVYWSVHALHLLGEKLCKQMQANIIDFLERCQSADGGFGGGPGHLPHLAPTYAAVNALVTIGTEQAYSAINRQALANFLARMVTPEGAFRMHEGGEVDIRGTYCAVAVARLTKLAVMPLFARTPRWIVQCQTYEGGFSGTPGLEAHGGYSFCGMAALTLLHSQHLADTTRLLRWVAGRQMRFSGGFQGRTNKLVDGCYSFWQGALFPVLHHTIAGDGGVTGEEEQCWLFHCEALQNYLLICCQSPRGGLIDKPGKSPDFYHTCYTLSGLSVAQHYCYQNTKTLDVVGHPDNEVALTHPLYNIGMTAALSADRHFSQLPSLQPSICSSAPSLADTARESDCDAVHDRSSSAFDGANGQRKLRESTATASNDGANGHRQLKDSALTAASIDCANGQRVHPEQRGSTATASIEATVKSSLQISQKEEATYCESDRWNKDEGSKNKNNGDVGNGSMEADSVGGVD